jgi:hypothetical protein
MTFDDIKNLIEIEGFASLKNKINQTKNYDCLVYFNGEWNAAQGWTHESEVPIAELSIPTNPKGELETIINDSGKSDAQKLADITAWKNAHVDKLQ